MRSEAILKAINHGVQNLQSEMHEKGYGIFHTLYIKDAKLRLFSNPVHPL